MIRQAMVPVALGRVMFGLLFGVSETNPVTLASVALLFGAMALVASYVPALQSQQARPRPGAP